MGLYALEGAMGLPFFAGGKSGIFDQRLDYILPASSMSNVVGFVLAAWVVGKIVENGKVNAMVRTMVAVAIGAIALYVPGLIWLAVWATKTQNMDWVNASQSALSWGLYPFFLGDALKAVIVGLVGSKLRLKAGPVE